MVLLVVLYGMEIKETVPRHKNFRKNQNITQNILNVVVFCDRKMINSSIDSIIFLRGIDLVWFTCLVTFVIQKYIEEVGFFFLFLPINRAE